MKQKREGFPTLGTQEDPHHVMGISGGKDSTALVVFMKKNHPEIFEKLTLFFTDTGTELQEIYEYLDMMERYLGKKIKRIKSIVVEDKKIDFTAHEEEDGQVPFDEVLHNKFNGFLPSPNARWCTRYLKIEPMEKWLGDDHCVSYIGLRADEPSRGGYDSKGKKNVNITPVYPFRENNIGINEVYQILEDSVGLPEYYKWRTRSGCYFCFYQRRVEYAILYHLYPEMFEEAKKYETSHADGRSFWWVKDKPLEYIEGNSQKIIVRYLRKQFKKTDEFYRTNFVYTEEEAIQMINDGKIKEYIDSWDLKRLHDVDGQNMDGCTVCAI